MIMMSFMHGLWEFETCGYLLCLEDIIDNIGINGLGKMESYPLPCSHCEESNVAKELYKVKELILSCLQVLG